jgi:hypothetical protein
LDINLPLNEKFNLSDTHISWKWTKLSKNVKLVYIRLIFEYACEVWDNCGTCHSNKLEKLQLEAARIVTGLPIFTKTDSFFLSFVYSF